MNCDQKKYNCGQILASSCIPYTGKDLVFLTDPTLLTCNANINDVFGLMDGALSTLISGNDLTELNPRCLEFDPTTITPAELHQVEIDKICGLDSSLTTLIQTVNNLDIATMLIAIDLQCIAPAASPCLTPPTTYELIAVLNVMVGEICALKTAVGI
jgi:hypothetical protein